MASKLEDRLAPNERIVFRARFGPIAIAVYVLIAALALAGLFITFDWAFGKSMAWAFSLFNLVFVFGFFGLLLFGQAILVTDQRVLYQNRLWKIYVEDVPLTTIEGVEFMPGIGRFGAIVTIYRHGDKKIGIGLVPNLQGLRDAIASQCGLPVPPRIDSIVLVSVGLFQVLGGISGMSAVFGQLFFVLKFKSLVIETVWDWLSSNPFQDLLFTGFTLALMFSSFVVGFAFLFLGRILGSIIGLVVSRILLTPDQAKYFLSAGFPSSSDHLFVKLFSGGRQQSARFLSLLYGQTIRCD